MVHATGLIGLQCYRQKGATLGGQAQHLLLAAMQHQWPCEPTQLLQTARSIHAPASLSTAFAPVALTEHLLKGALITGERMVNRSQQGVQLNRSAIAHRRAREHPNRTQARMTG